MQNDHEKVITIDGPSGSGKSTVSRKLAAKMGYAYLDTGAMYRAIGLAASRKQIPFTDGATLKNLCLNLNIKFDFSRDSEALFLDGEDVSRLIRTPAADMLASDISKVREVRDVMCVLQRRIASEHSQGIVAEGRDMGTVVFPGARYKFFLMADLKERAKRRFLEMRARGESVSEKSVAKKLEKRDSQDEKRAFAPLKPAKDAFIIDSTEMSVEDVVETMLTEIADLSSKAVDSKETS